MLLFTCGPDAAAFSRMLTAQSINLVSPGDVDAEREAVIEESRGSRA